MRWLQASCRLVLGLALILGLFAGPVMSAVAATVPKAANPVQTQIYTGDLGSLLQEHGSLRVLVVYSKTQYFIDGGRPYGLTYQALQQFESFLKRRFQRKAGRPISLKIIPVEADQLLPKLIAGEGDLVAADVSITPDNFRLVAFSLPFSTRIDEVLVTGPSAPSLNNLSDLSGRQLLVRRDSRYYPHLQALNQNFAKAGKSLIQLQDVNPNLDDEDLLEMINAGLLPYLVVDRHVAAFWARVFPNLRVRHDLSVFRGARIAWAFRKNSPELADAVDEFVQIQRESPLPADRLVRYYKRADRWVKPALKDEEIAKFDTLYPLFDKAGQQYDIDPLWLAAVAYQESGLNPKAQNAAGPVGLMQLLPATARAMRVGDPHNAEHNVQAAAKYLRKIMDEHLSEADMDETDRMLLALAAYNAGPNRIDTLRKKAVTSGQDPNRWFDEMERQVAGVSSGHTVRYVDNVYKYYLAYQLLMQRRETENREAPHL